MYVQMISARRPDLQPKVRTALDGRIVSPSSAVRTFGGMIRGRGLAIMAVFGNIVTTWSWFGVNQLGVGLHAYGFMESTVMVILFFVLSQTLIMGLASIPLSYWRSFSKGADQAKSQQELEPAPAD